MRILPLCLTYSKLAPKFYKLKIRICNWWQSFSVRLWRSTCPSDFWPLTLVTMKPPVKLITPIPFITSFTTETSVSPSYQNTDLPQHTHHASPLVSLITTNGSKFKLRSENLHTSIRPHTMLVYWSRSAYSLAVTLFGHHATVTKISNKKTKFTKAFQKIISKKIYFDVGVKFE